MTRWVLRVVVVWYRIAVWIRYPADLRARYGDDILDGFRQWASDALEMDGFAGLARIGLLAVKDLLRPLPGTVAVTGRAPWIPESVTAPARMRRRPGVGLLEDAAFAARALARAPRFTALLVAIIGIGIALNGTVFSVVNAYLLKPLPYPDAERLVAIGARGTLSWTEVDDVLDLAISWDLDAFTLVGDPKPELVRGAWVTPGFLEAYAVEAELGRLFSHEEAGPGGSAVAMISHAIWKQRFGGDPDVIGQSFRAFMSDRPDEGEVFTVVGVLPEDFWYVNPYVDVLVPIREERGLYAGRLREGVSMETATRVLNERAADKLRELGPDARIQVTSLQERYVGPVRPTLVVLQVAVLLVLLIACANAAVLLLMRAIGRDRELGVRRALGAGPSRIARQLLLEGLLLAGMAGTVGVGLSIWMTTGVRDLVVARLGRTAPGGVEALTVDGNVLFGTVVVAGIVGVLFGLVPLAVSAGGPLTRLLGSSAREGDTRTRRNVRSLLVGAEFTLTLALLMGAGLLVRSSLHLATVDIGFETSGLSRASFGLRSASYPAASDQERFMRQFLSALRTTPGVRGAALASTRPLENANEGDLVRAEEGGDVVAATWTAVSDDYFATIGVPLLRGRDFDLDDVADAEPVAIVSQSLAERLWPGEDPIGRRVLDVHDGPAGSGSAEESLLTVVGLVGDIRRGLGGASEAELYRPLQQDGRLYMYVLTRAEAGAGPLTTELERALAAIDSEAPLYDAVTMEAVERRRAAPTRFITVLMVAFASFAGLLAIVGMYGVIAYGAQQQRREIAIRMALGADADRVTGRLVGSGAVIVAIGAVLGSVGGIRLGRGLEGQLHGVSAWDPTTHAIVAGTLLLTAMLAVWLPARRAARLEPMGVLRDE